MTRYDMIHDCEAQVQELLPEIPRPEQKALARLVGGVVASGQVSLRGASAATPGAAQDLSKQRRAQRLLANPRLAVNRAQRRLVVRVLARCRGRVDVLLDATTTGATATQAGTVTLCFALAWRRRAIPLVWRTWTADEPGQEWADALREMASVIQAALPTPAQVVVLADRGLSGGPFARLWQEVGWHFLVRVIRTTRVRPASAPGGEPPGGEPPGGEPPGGEPGGAIVEIGALAPTPGSRCCLSGVHLYAQREKPGRRWITRWETALPLQVVAVWRRAEEEAWLLVTDLPATLARCREYRRRTWEEELFRDLKGMGWQWQQSRVRAPERVARLLLVLALATLWMLALAERVVRRGWRPVLEARSRRECSAFQLGLRFLRRCLANDQPVLVCWRLFPVVHPPLKLS